MKKIFIFVTFICCSFTTTDCLNVDIILMGDLSSSVSNNESFLYAAFDEFKNRFQLSESGVKIGIVTFNSNAFLNCQLTSDTSYLKSKLNVLKFTKASGNTNMAEAFALSVEELLKHGRPFCRKMIVVISDGYPDNPDVNKNIAAQIKASNINIFGILIKNTNTETDYDYNYGFSTNSDNNPEFMKAISSENCYMESDYINLVTMIKKLEICL